MTANKQQMEKTGDKYSKLIVKKGEDTPAIILNPNKQKFQIVGTSWPENAITLFEPIINWFKNYFNTNPLDNTIVEFRLIYFNTSTSKQIAVLLTLLKEKSEKNNILIKWYYEADDYDMLKEGKRYSAVLGINFEYVETKSR